MNAINTIGTAAMTIERDSVHNPIPIAVPIVRNRMATVINPTVTFLNPERRRLTSCIAPQKVIPNPTATNASPIQTLIIKKSMTGISPFMEKLFRTTKKNTSELHRLAIVPIPAIIAMIFAVDTIAREG